MVKKGSRELSEADFKAFQKRQKMEDILGELYKKGSSFPAELEKLTGLDIEEVNQLLNELVKERLVEKIIGKYYKLTYEGNKLANQLMYKETQEQRRYF